MEQIKVKRPLFTNWYYTRDELIELLYDSLGNHDFEILEDLIEDETDDTLERLNAPDRGEAR